MSAETIAAIAGVVLLIYLSGGIAFVLPFLLRGMRKIDETTHGATWGFKLIVIPGIIVLWPLLLKKWLQVNKKDH
ncbi:MAG: hypothetical protein QM791_01475 [Ferruginibacter sp.]